jgi:L-malate glycosyltransferase
MRILLLSDADNPHTMKWAIGLANAGLTVGVFSFRKPLSNIYNDSRIELLNPNVYDQNIVTSNVLQKLKYVTAVSWLKKAIYKFKPDILHAHYASSYGMLGALCGFHPYVISVWGSDVYDFPKQGFLQKLLLKYNLSKADMICSTSHVMQKETQQYTQKKAINVIPFGVDTNIFKKQSSDSLFESGSIVIGTIKTLDEKYGIRYLIEAFNIVRNKYRQLPLRLLLVGDGAQKNYLMELVKDLNLNAVTKFTGNIPHSQIQQCHNMLDIAVYVSTLDSESFGVSVIESSACEKPVIVSRVGGLTEVVNENVSGIVVPPRNAESTAEAIEKLLLNTELRLKMGSAGRQRVKDNYEWNACVDKMIRHYLSLKK